MQKRLITPRNTAGNDEEAKALENGGNETSGREDVAEKKLDRQLDV